MFSIFHALFGHIAERLFGLAPILGGAVLALAGWFFDYAVREFPRRLGLSLLMWGTGVLLFGLVMYLDWDMKSLFYCVIWGTLMYLPMRKTMGAR